MGRAAGLLLGSLLFCGCVERELRIESEPPGADIWIDGKQKGQTPYVEKFTFYGARGVELRREGYTPVRRTVVVNAPWYQYIPLDLFFEHLWPGTLKDEHFTQITMVPEVEEDADALIERAKKWKVEAETPPK